MVHDNYIIDKGNLVTPTFKTEHGVLMFIYDMSRSGNGFRLQLKNVSFPEEDSKMKFGYSGNLEYSICKYSTLV